MKKLPLTGYVLASEWVMGECRWTVAGTVPIGRQTTLSKGQNLNSRMTLFMGWSIFFPTYLVGDT